MTSQITSLLQHGWENLWKNKTLWLFSSLVLVEPILRLVIPIPKSANLLLTWLDILISLIAVYFDFLSIAGVLFIAYSIVIDHPVDFRTAFDASQKLFWRVVAISFSLLVLSVPFLCIVTFLLWQSFQIKDLFHALSYAGISLSVFVAMWSFPIIEAIANDSTVGKSIKIAWGVFIENFAKLAITGLLLAMGLYILNLSIGLIIVLVQSNFNISALSKLDFINPALSFSTEKFYKLITAIPRAIWQAYSASIFVLAYLEYGGAKMKKQWKS